MNMKKLIPVLGVAALAYVWWLTRRQYNAQAVSAAVTGKKIACPTGYAFTVDNAGKTSCVPIVKTPDMVSIPRGENVVYDQNGNLVSLDSMFADKPNFVPFSPMTGK